MNAPMIRTEQRQHQTVTPRLQQAVRLLQLSSLDFAQEVQEAMGKNPFLESDDSTPGDEPASDAHAGDGSAANAAEAHVETTSEHVAAAEPDVGWERDSWQSASSSPGSGGGDSDIAMMELVAADVGLRAHLHGQTRVMPLSDRDRMLVGAIIESLDDDGYLRTPLEELAQLTDVSPPVEDCEMNTALKLVQSLEPCGIAARSVAECLLLQVEEMADEGERALARVIISDHMPRLAQRDIVSLSRVLGRDVATVEAVCDRIRHLDPRPGWRFGPSQFHYVTPDVIVRKLRGEWAVTLNPAVVPKVRLNHMYAELFQQHRERRHSALAAHLQEARWTVRNVEQRFSTILMVAEAILRRQKHFLEFGPLAMKPLGLREIADEVGLHESTVSRVTNNKYMATPAGVFELKYFFSRAMATSSGGACSATAIRGVIKDMLDAESATEPLSDAEIARQLVRQGLTVARRTVTKYRQMLKVPAVERRRRHA